MRPIVRVPFLATAPLLVVQCILWRGSRYIILRMAVDSGASLVMIKPDILVGLGYDLTAARPMTIYGIHAQALTAPQVTLERFGVIGAEEANVDCLALSLPPQVGLDGLVGLSYLQRFSLVTFNFSDNSLMLQR
jgi:predicted aspartyl protease